LEEGKKSSVTFGSRNRKIMIKDPSYLENHFLMIAVFSVAELVVEISLQSLMNSLNEPLESWVNEDIWPNKKAY